MGKLQSRKKKTICFSTTQRTGGLSISLKDVRFAALAGRAKQRVFKQKNLRSLSHLSRFHQIPLSDQTKAIICGTLLGDGCLVIGKGYKNARLLIRHSIQQEEYFNWLAQNLQEISSPKSIQIQSKNKDSYSNKAKLLFQSRALESLTMFHQLTYKKSRLSIQRRWLNKMNPLSLAIWWCDDGSIIGSPRRRGVICTDGFDEKSVRILARYLQKVWNVNASVAPIRRNRKYGNYSQEEYFRLWFSTNELKKFLRIIMPYIPVSSMVYKTILVYKDFQFQQRWISEVKSALPQFTDAIDSSLSRYLQQKYNDCAASNRGECGFGL